MRLTITRQNLQRGLAAVSASIPGKTTLPVLSNVLIESEDNSVWISGTDLDVSIRVRVPAEVADAGAITAPGRKLLELTREQSPTRRAGRSSTACTGSSGTA